MVLSPLASSSRRKTAVVSSSFMINRSLRIPANIVKEDKQIRIVQDRAAPS